MSAAKHTGIFTLFAWAASQPVQAQAQEPPHDNPSPIELRLAQAGVPGASPWEEPAVLSYRIDRDGDDSYMIEIDGGLDITILPSRVVGTAVHTAYLGPTISYKGSNASDARSDVLTAGLAAKLWRDQYLFGARDVPSRALFYALTANLGYKREGIYPDLDSAPCDTDTTSVSCRKQFSELLTASLGFYPYMRGFQRRAGGMRYAVRPRLEIGADSVLDGAVDPDTGAKATGERLSALGGLGLEFWPSQRLEVNATGAVRQRIAASRRRTDVPDSTEGRMQLSLTYHLLPADADWKAGISAIWTEGGDSFAGDAKESTILLAFRVGRF